MTRMTPTPTSRIRIIDRDNANEEITAHLERLAAEGERPWCEVFYPAPTHLTAAEREQWETAQHDAFDAVELVDGVIVTLPPYAELEQASA